MEFSILDGVAEVFGDTSFFYAALDQNDANHPAAVAISRQLARRGIKVVITWDIVVEAVTLLRYRLSFRSSETFLRNMMPKFEVVLPTEADRQLAIEFYLDRSAERRLSLCDSLSYVIVSTRLNWIPCLSFDADFAAMGLTVVR